MVLQKIPELDTISGKPFIVGQIINQITIIHGLIPKVNYICMKMTVLAMNMVHVVFRIIDDMAEDHAAGIRPVMDI